jgi:hypothetical protein
MDTGERARKPGDRWRGLAVFVGGFVSGGLVVAATCFGAAFSARANSDAHEDFLSTIKGYAPWYREEIRLELQTLLSVDLPDSTLVMRKDSRGWEEPWLSMVF